MTTPESTSAEAFNQYLPGRLIAASNGWKNLLVRIYSEPRVKESVIYPAVAEPRIVRILSGAAVVEERELGGPWLKTRVEAGDFFLTASQSPYEVRWRAIGPEPYETMHLYLGLPVFNRAIEEAFQKDQGATQLRDLSGFKDNFLLALLEGLHKELTSRDRGGVCRQQARRGRHHEVCGHRTRRHRRSCQHRWPWSGGNGNVQPLCANEGKQSKFPRRTSS
jgi:AraC family transcriptional regulator